MSFYIDYFTSSFFCLNINVCKRKIENFSVFEHCAKCKLYKQFRKEIYDIRFNNTLIARLVKLYKNSQLIHQYLRVLTNDQNIISVLRKTFPNTPLIF